MPWCGRAWSIPEHVAVEAGSGDWACNDGCPRLREIHGDGGSPEPMLEVPCRPGLAKAKLAVRGAPITTDSGTPRRRALVTKLRLRSWNQTPVSFTALHARRNTLRMSFHASAVSGLVKTESLLMCRGWASSASRNRRQLISAPARRPPRWWPSCLCPRARGCGSGTRNVRASARRTGS